MWVKARNIPILTLVGLCIVGIAFLGCPKPDPTPEPVRPGSLLSDLEIVKVRLEAGDSPYQHDEKTPSTEEATDGEADESTRTTEGSGYGSDTPRAQTEESAPGIVLNLNFSPPAVEPAIIFYFTEGGGPIEGKPNAVRWEFAGLEEGNKVYIYPKDNFENIFGFSEEFDGKPAVSLAPGDDTIISGEVVKGIIDPLFAELQNAEGTYVSWYYNVVVVNSQGDVVAMYDPEVRVKKYP